MSKKHIKQSQRQLKKAGFYFGAIDGDWGALSVKATKKAIESNAVKLKDESGSSKGLTERDKKRLAGVHKDLQRLVKHVKKTSDVDFFVGEGRRTTKRQKQLIKQAKSTTMNSRHLTGHAVDLIVRVDGKVTWKLKHYRQLAKDMKKSAKKLGIPITWGGDWKTFKDGVHFQLSWGSYSKYT